MEKIINDQNSMIDWGEKIGARLGRGDVIELVGDIGVGKTTLVKGIMRGAGVEAVVSSPSFTISQSYEGNDGLILKHYDLYRLDQAGLIGDQIKEELASLDDIIILEWGEAVQATLPTDRLTIRINLIDEATRRLQLTGGGAKSQKLLQEISRL